MDGISAYTNISQGFQQTGLSPRQQSLDRARAGRGVENTTQGTENHPEKPASIQDKVTLSAEAQQKLRELSVRDQEVRTHEAAHAAVGGRYAGAPQLGYEQGPDGQRYAVEGKVNIDTSEIPGDPQQTLAKADIIKKAALAPQNPSAADRAIAAEATQMASKARMEMSAEQNESLQRGVKGAIASEETAQEDPSHNDAESGTQQPNFKIRGQLLNIRT
jgi:SprA-related family